MSTLFRKSPGPILGVLLVVLIGSLAGQSDQTAHHERKASVTGIHGPRSASSLPDATLPVKQGKDEPPPRWAVSIREADDIHVTPDTLLVKGEGDLTALDRQDGHLLWHSEGQNSDRTEGTTRTVETASVSLVGVTTLKRQPQVAVLLYWYWLYAHDTTNYQTVKTSKKAELRGVELRTGRQLWRSSLELNPISQATEAYYNLIWWPLGVYGQTIILHKIGTPADVRFLDARTGAVLNPAHPHALTFLRDSATLYGARFTDWGGSDGGGLIQFDPKASKPISLSPLNLDGYGSSLGVIGDKIVFFVVTNDGSTGHSIWPNYLICYDGRGKKLWQYPEHLPDRWNFDELEKRADEQLDFAVMNPLCQNVLTVDSGGRLYMLDVNTGKLLRKRTPMKSGDWQPYAQGYIALDRVGSSDLQKEKSDTVLLRYINGRTNREEKAILLKPGSYPKLFQAGPDFLFFAYNGRQSRLLYYSEQTLRPGWKASERDIRLPPFSAPLPDSNLPVAPINGVNAGAEADATAFVQAAYRGDVDTVKRLLDKGVDVNTNSSSGMTALILAADYGHPAVVQLLLERGADVKAKTNDGWTALMWAAVSRNADCVRFLLAKGAEVNVVGLGDTPLILAAGCGDAASVRLLLERGANVNAANYSGDTALIEAAMRGDAACVQLLLEKGASVNAKTNYSFSALMFAVSDGHIDAVRLLLAGGAEVNAKPDDGETVLMKAVRREDAATVRLLLARADVNMRDNDGETVLMEAARHGDAAIVQLLLARGARVNARGKDGRTALMEAISSDLATSDEIVPIARLLLASRADIHIRDKNGKTALIEAKESRNAAVERLLRQAGAKQ